MKTSTQVKIGGKSFIVGFDKNGKPVQTPKINKPKPPKEEVISPELAFLEPIDPYKCSGCQKKQKIAKSLTCGICRKTDKFCASCLEKRIDQKFWYWLTLSHRVCADKKHGQVKED